MAKPTNKGDQASDDLRALLERARKGDDTTLPAVRKLLEDPGEVFRHGGELAHQAESSFVRALGGTDLVFQAAITRRLVMLRKELLGGSPTAVERLLVERVVACWLQVQDADIRYAQRQGDLTIRQADYHQRRMDAAHRRYLSALKSLALVRKLAVPVLQLNIAKEQVNVASLPTCAANPPC